MERAKKKLKEMRSKDRMTKQQKERAVYTMRKVEEQRKRMLEIPEQSRQYLTPHDDELKRNEQGEMKRKPLFPSLKKKEMSLNKSHTVSRIRELGMEMEMEMAMEMEMEMEMEDGDGDGDG